MTKRYWWILVVYILTQFSALLGIPLLHSLGVPLEQIPGLWLSISFTIGLIIILILLKPDIVNRRENRSRVSRSQAAFWAIIGIFMAFTAQYVAIAIEMYVLGIEPGSENTEQIVQYAKATPMFIFVLAVIGPILEEIVFRLIIFGALYKRYNFWIAASISSLIFAAVHWDFTHIIIYAAVGFTFAYLYVKTQRIIVPIIAHVAVNTFVAMVNVVFGERLEELQKQLEQIQGFIGGFLL
ncbi:CPBP family intramembrane glutamic endopeptidase [Bacillus sp. FJAT-45350]|uniref:CPBP family intramembrane glutamic endopeptidase n=1 Tax=Bacillus sp. FJAT-45350 TaxID=2011014 RepID=UPI000BB6FE59|nr:type II CAAX endopeptidase family protein [Bacillus sp. FJAT-45350]